MLFPNEDAYDGIIRPVAAQQHVPVALVKAVIAHESRFVPTAIRGEPQLNDASRGLMQLLFATAQELGFNGEADALFNPGVNIPLGIRYLAKQLVRAGGDWAGAVSAYNGGYRPELGFGRRATKVVTVCLARDQVTGKCIRQRTVPIGEFANQDYVNDVFRYWDHYKGDEAAPVTPAPASAPAPASGSGCFGLVLLLAAAPWVWELFR